MAIHLSVELESIPHQVIVNPGKNKNFSLIGKITAEPVASRQAIDVAISFSCKGEVLFNSYLNAFCYEAAR